MHLKELPFPQISEDLAVSICSTYAKLFSPPPSSIVSLARLLTDGPGTAFLCFSSKKCRPNQLMGFALTGIVRDHHWVDLLAVLPDQQRLGVGKALMMRVFKHALQGNLQVSLKYDASKWKLCQFYSQFHPVIADASPPSHLLLPHFFSTKPIFDPKQSLKALKQHDNALVIANSKRQAGNIWFYKHVEVATQLVLWAALALVVIPSLIEAIFHAMNRADDSQTL